MEANKPTPVPSQEGNIETRARLRVPLKGWVGRLKTPRTKFLEIQ